MRVFLKISGKVQGVGYRWFVRDTAAKHALTGLVRNRADGSVEAEAQGGEKAIEAFILEIRTGHPWAEVGGAQARPIAEKKGEKDFIIAP
ncbi:MAG: acylphosphatase [Elusimicrobiales bacterium]|jgi:acylphosphatase